MRAKINALPRLRSTFRAHRILAALALSLVTATTAFVAIGTPPARSGAATTFSSDYGTGRWMAADPNGGYWTTTFSGAVTPHGGAPQLGSPAASGLSLSRPVMGMAPTVDGRGYWLVASDGGVFSYGDAQFYGSTGSIELNQPIVGMTQTPDGHGYWLVASDGGIFSYGDAQFYGSTGSIRLNQPIVGMAPTADGHGYWLVASDGGIFAYGDAQFYGSTGSLRLNRPIQGMAPTPDGGGYWLVAEDGGVFNYGNAPFDGSLGGTGAQALGLAVTPLQGYSIITADGNAYTFTNPTAQPSSLTTGPAQAHIAGGPSQGDCAPTSTPSATPDQSLQNVFSGQYGPGWVGGDATYSTALPSGQEAFDFSDTLVGTAQASGSATIVGMPSNSELVGNVPTLFSVFGGSYGAPASLIPDSGGDSWEVAATYMENGNQLVFVNEFAPRSGTIFDTFTGRSGIATLSLASGKPTFQSLTLLHTDATTQWGNAVMQDGGYDYVYGLDYDTSANVYHGMKLARVALGVSLAAANWTYWNGTQWVSGEANAADEVLPTVFTGVIALANDSGYMAVSIPGGLANDTTVDLSFSCSPQGPWSSPRAVYSIPQVSQFHDEFAYIPTFHPELSGNGGLVVSYNIDTTDGLSALAGNVHAYQPQFLQLG